MVNLGQRVQKARKDKDWSQARLAAEVTKLGFKIGQSGIGNIFETTHTVRSIPVRMGMSS